jgi:multidrug efflux pump subunit AcrA (membrane-fusion protein)
MSSSPTLLPPPPGREVPTTPAPDSQEFTPVPGTHPARPLAPPPTDEADTLTGVPHRGDDGERDSAALRSLAMVPARPWARRVLLAFFGLVAVVAACLIFVPWQQNVTGAGRVIPYDAMSRPQSIAAQIPGRIAEWRVQEGQVVKKGQVIGRIEDIDSKFLDQDQVERIRAQRAALNQRLAEAQTRAARIEQQIAALGQSRDASIGIAGERLKQARERESIARRSLSIAEQNYRIVDRVTRNSARERAAQAQDRILQARQDLAAAETAFEVARIQRERVADLFAKDLRSKRDDELAEQDLVARRTGLEKARAAVEIASREAKVVGLTQEEADLRRKQAEDSILQAQNNVDIALRDIAALSNDRIKVTNDTAASINVAEANLQSVRETVQSIRESQAKLDVDLQNLRRRVDQQVIRAPRDGRVVRIRVVGAGETVKSGDALATILPETADRAVELTLSGHDTPLVSVGRHVRLQFNGWPAVQISGFPRAAYGTFAGRVAVIDAIDDGSGKYRVIIKPDTAAIEGRTEQTWPSPALLRPGTDAVGWVMLDTVPLWWELWRRFNAFPPSVQQDPSKPYQDKKGDKDGGDEYGGGKSDKGGKPKTGDIKLPKL